MKLKPGTKICQFIFAKMSNPSKYEGLYKDQKKGEWLRFAVPMRSMIDSDNVPHLPKLGKALGQYFIETYWSYPKAVFHPHNEFVVMKNVI